MLSAFSLGRLPEADREAIGGHVESSCPLCEAVLEELEDRGNPLIADLRTPPPISTAEADAVCRKILADTPNNSAAITEPYQRRAAVSPAMGSLYVGRRAGSSGEDIPTLLRKRLRYATALIACIYTVYFLKLITFYADYHDPFDRYPSFAIVHITLATEILAAWILWSKMPLSLRQLRLIELIAFGLPLLNQFWLECQRLLLDHQLQLYLKQQIEPITTGRTHVLPWFAIIIGYGVLIPNTWRRCSGVVMVIAGLAVALNLTAAVVDGIVLEPTVLHHILEVGLWLGVAVAFAIYNSYRIEVLRKRATRLGKYQLKRVLGEKGMGVIYLAEHDLVKRPCAIKVIRPDRINDPDCLRRFEKEVQATARLTHPNTVQIFDYGRDDDGSFYYAMEYLNGPDLNTLVKKHGPLPPARTIHLLRQICSALAEAHAQRLFHRDIKPENIIVCERGGVPDVAKLLDFGLVREESVLRPVDDRPTRAGTIMGTPDYMSPEQAHGKSDQADERSDIYSLGATAYFLLTGRPPFVRRTVAEILTAHIREIPIPPRQYQAQLPEDLQAVVLRCLEKDPARRYQSAKELEDALADCV